MGRAVDVEPGLREKERLLHTRGSIGGGEKDRGRGVRRVVWVCGGRGGGEEGRGRKRRRRGEEELKMGGSGGDGGPLVGARLVGGRKMEYE